MRFGFNILPAFLHSFGSRKAPSSSRNTHLPNIFARRNPHLAARSAKLRATKSAARIRNRPPAACMTWGSSGFAAHGAKLHSGGNPTARHRRVAPRPLRRCNSVLVPQPPKHAQLPQLPGAYVLEPSFVEPSFPNEDKDKDQDDGRLTPLVQQKLFLDALYAGRQALLHAAGERQKEAEARRRAEDAEYRRLLERDSGRAQAAHRRAEDEEFARLLREDRRKAQAAHRRAVDGEFARLLEEDRWKAQEAHRRAEVREAARRARERRKQAAEERRRRRAEQEEAMERARREREREHRERERENCSSRVAVTGTAHVHPAERLRLYEAKWVALRSNVTRVEPFRFRDFPWPVFWDVLSGEDIVEEGVVQFMRHLLPDCVQGQGGGLAKFLRSEMLRWHPDKFKGQVLDKVIECDRKGVSEAAEKVVRILTQLSAEMRQS